MKTLFSLTTVALLALSAGANATTYSNSYDGQIIYFGNPDTTNYGQTFQLSAPGILKDWSFYAVDGYSGDLLLNVSAWNGSTASGSALYTSQLLHYAGGNATLAFSNINLTLQSNQQYVAYISTAGVATPVSNVGIAGSNSNGGLPGKFVFANTGGGSGQDASWYTGGWSPQNMQYTANVSPVPEPETYALMFAGLGMVGFMARRNKKTGS